jgi:hypothetical protein
MNCVKIRADKLTPKIHKLIYDLLEGNGYYQLTIVATDLVDVEDLLIPWDADFDVRVGKDGIMEFQLNGGAGPSGFGYCLVVVPLEKAQDYSIVLESFDGPELPPELVELAEPD